MKHYNTLMNKMKSNYIVDFFNKYEKNVGYIKNTIMPRYIEMENEKNIFNNIININKIQIYNEYKQKYMEQLIEKFQSEVYINILRKIKSSQKTTQRNKNTVDVTNKNKSPIEDLDMTELTESELKVEKIKKYIKILYYFITNYCVLNENNVKTIQNVNKKLTEKLFIYKKMKLNEPKDSNQKTKSDLCISSFQQNDVRIMETIFDGIYMEKIYQVTKTRNKIVLKNYISKIVFEKMYKNYIDISIDNERFFRNFGKIIEDTKYPELSECIDIYSKLFKDKINSGVKKEFKMKIQIKHKLLKKHRAIIKQNYG